MQQLRCLGNGGVRAAPIARWSAADIRLVGTATLKAMRAGVPRNGNATATDDTPLSLSSVLVA